MSRYAPAPGAAHDFDKSYCASPLDLANIKRKAIDPGTVLLSAFGWSKCRLRVGPDGHPQRRHPARSPLRIAGHAERVVALEVKLARTVGDDDVRHLHWLRGEIGDDLLDAAVITTGTHAYRRDDGIAVVPAVLLGA
jgi:hypothetical protein